MQEINFFRTSGSASTLLRQLFIKLTSGTRPFEVQEETNGLFKDFLFPLLIVFRARAKYEPRGIPGARSETHKRTRKQTQTRQRKRTREGSSRYTLASRSETAVNRLGNLLLARSDERETQAYKKPKSLPESEVSCVLF